MSIKSKISQTPADPNKPRHPVAMLIEGIPETVKDDFKAACARKKITMRDALIEFMAKFAVQNLHP